MWIEMFAFIFYTYIIKSRPVRALWIEICHDKLMAFRRDVEAREGLVD